MLQGQVTQALGHPTALGCGVLICISSWNTRRPRGVNELFRNRLEDYRVKGTEGLRGTHRPRRAELRTQTEERLDHGHEVATQGDTGGHRGPAQSVPPGPTHSLAPPGPRQTRPAPAQGREAPGPHVHERGFRQGTERAHASPGTRPAALGNLLAFDEYL